MKVSIITINYNNYKGLQNTIESVINQSAKSAIEYIVIDGASTDGSTQLLSEYATQIDYAISEPDKGIYNAMNKGIAKATGNYYLFLNSGDYLYSTETIQKCLKELTSGEDLIMGQVKILPSGRIGWNDLKTPFTLLDFYKSGPIPHQACFIKNTLFDNLLYDENLKIVADWKFFMQKIVFEKCSYKLIDCIVSNFEEGGISANRFLCDQEREQVLKSLLPPAIYLDYYKWTNGSEYTGTTYESFFANLRKNNMKCAKLIYTLSVFIVKILSWGRPSLKFVHSLPLRWK